MGGRAEQFHGDQIGTTRLMTDASTPHPQITRQAVYTAFGEPVSSSGTTATRYGYAGAHGYETGLLPDWPFLHVGARWYDPSTGRFLERDPTSVRGGVNIYAYVAGNPTGRIDPSGLLFGEGGIWGPNSVDRHLDNFRSKRRGQCSNPIKEIQSEQQARDLANASALTIEAIGWCFGPITGAIGTAAIASAYIHDYILKLTDFCRAYRWRKENAVFQADTGVVETT
jgi:RHS repeat-associated protein